MNSKFSAIFFPINWLFYSFSLTHLRWVFLIRTRILFYLIQFEYLVNLQLFQNVKVTKHIELFFITFQIFQQLICQRMREKALKSVKYLWTWNVASDVLAKTPYHLDDLTFLASYLQYFQDVISTFNLDIHFWECCYWILWNVLNKTACWNFEFIIHD